MNDELPLATPTAAATDLPKVTITTDGGCEPNPGPGAWAAILRFGASMRMISGFDPATTNNRMELRAIIEALEALKWPCAVTLRTDSQLAIWAIEAGYLPETAKRRRAYEKRGVNMDLVRRLWARLTIHAVTPVWVKGHAGDRDNEACDQVCAQTIRDRAVDNPTPTAF